MCLVIGVFGVVVQFSICYVWQRHKVQAATNPKFEFEAEAKVATVTANTKSARQVCFSMCWVSVVLGVLVLVVVLGCASASGGVGTIFRDQRA